MTATPFEAALFQNDESLRAVMAPHLTPAKFAAAIVAIEAYGFPKTDPIFKGRYFPAVRAWLDKQAGAPEPVRDCACAHVRESIKAERERCGQIVSTRRGECGTDWPLVDLCVELENAIRGNP